MNEKFEPAISPGSLRVSIQEDWVRDGHVVYVVARTLDGRSVINVGGHWQEVDETAQETEPSIFLPRGGIEVLAKAVGYHVDQPQRELIDTLKDGLVDARGMRDEFWKVIGQVRRLQPSPDDLIRRAGQNPDDRA